MNRMKFNLLFFALVVRLNFNRSSREGAHDSALKTRPIARLSVCQNSVMERGR